MCLSYYSFAHTFHPRTTRNLACFLVLFVAHSLATKMAVSPRPYYLHIQLTSHAFCRNVDYHIQNKREYFVHSRPAELKIHLRRQLQRRSSTGSPRCKYVCTLHFRWRLPPSVTASEAWSSVGLMNYDFAAMRDANAPLRRAIVAAVMHSANAGQLDQLGLLG